MWKNNGFKGEEVGYQHSYKMEWTYKVLNDALKYKVVITKLFNSDPAGHHEDGLTIESQWEFASTICDILETFAYATTVF